MGRSAFWPVLKWANCDFMVKLWSVASFLAKKSGQMASFEKKSGQKNWAFLVVFRPKMDKNRPKMGVLPPFSCHFWHFSMIFEFCGQKPTFILN